MNEQATIPQHPATPTGRGIVGMHKALTAARAALRGIANDSKSSGSAGFAYASVHAVIAACRQALDSAGLTLTTAGRTIEWFDAETIKASETNMVTWGIVKTWWTLTDGENWHVFQADVPLCGNKQRPPDQSSGVADSYALKFVLRDLLLLPFGEDAEEMPAEPAPAPETVEIPQDLWDAMTDEQAEKARAAFPDGRATAKAIESMRQKVAANNEQPEGNVSKPALKSKASASASASNRNGGSGANQPLPA